MSKTAESWVVYLMTLRNHPTGMRAVCEQHEWETMDAANPGFHKLIQEGIASEREAELLARGTLGDRVARLTKPRS